MRKHMVLFCLITQFSWVSAQQFMTENFSYPAGLQLTANGWFQNGINPTNPISVSNTGMNFPGYVLSGVGNATYLLRTGQDVYRNLPVQVTTGNLYAAFMYRPDTVRTGDYVFGFHNSMSLTAVAARVYMRVASSGYYRLGLAKSTETPIYSTDSFVVGSTGMIVVRYQFKTGATNNDSVYLYQFKTTLPSTEPATALLSTSGRGTADFTNLFRVALRQGIDTLSPSVSIDGIRIGGNWSDLNAATQNAPNPLQFVFVNNISYNSARINIFKPVGYSNPIHTVLIFLKRGTSIQTGNPNRNPSYYQADSNFSGSGTKYQYDTAYCVMKGDTTFVNVSGLAKTTTYTVVGFAVNDADSAFSLPQSTTFTTLSTAPGQLPFLFTNNITATTARVQWNKPAGYNNNNHSILVFLKRGNSIVPGNPTWPASKYTADANFAGSGTPYQFDTAVCVFKGDTTILNLTGLAPMTTYTLLGFTHNDADSNYSLARIATFTTINTAPGPLGFIFAGNITANTARLQWSKPAGYKNQQHSVLVFLKRGNTIAPGNPNWPANKYAADPNFAGSGTPYQFDTAKCVFNGDTTFIDISGLLPLTRYTVLGFTHNDADSNYSAARTTTFVTTSTAPGQPFGANFQGLSTTTARVSWTRNPNYNNTNHTTLVFVKQAVAIGTGINNKNPLLVIADSNFLGSGTRYWNDTAARCVYNGDGTNVIVTNLKPGTRYYVIVIGANVFDSAYSNAANGTGVTPSGGPAALNQLRFIGRLENNNTVSWTKPTSYNAALNNVLIFMRQDTINYAFSGPTRNSNLYVADSNFAGSGSTFEGDPLAKCIYNGDGNNVSISNLKLNKMYYLVGYVVRTDTSLYSLPIYTSSRTMLDTVGNLNWTAASTTTATISWVPPANFTTFQYTILVFLKANSAVNSGSPTRAPNRYNANANFGSGSAYQHDAAAFCVYRGTGNSVTARNLVQGTTYHALVYVVRTQDSVYSYPRTVSGNVSSPPPVYPIGPLVKINYTTGVVDSINKRALVRGIVYGNNMSGTGLNFVLRDGTGGICIQNTIDFSYIVKEGDSLEVNGTVSQNRGLAVLSNISSLAKIGIGVSLAKPKPIEDPNDLTENDLVKIPRLVLAPQIAAWPTTGTVKAMNLNTGDTVDIRITSTSAMGGNATPPDEFSLTGLGMQQSSSTSAPWSFDGYYVVPRKMADIIPSAGDTIGNFPFLTPNTTRTIFLNGDTNQTVSFSSGTSHVIRGVGTVHYVFLIDKSSGDFSLPMFGKATGNGGLDTTGTINYADLADAFPGLPVGDSVGVKFTMMATFNFITKLASQNILMWVKMGVLNTGGGSGMIESIEARDILVYPNPANEWIQVQSRYPVQSLVLYNTLGAQVASVEGTNQVSTVNLHEGIYFMAIKTNEGTLMRKIEVRH